MTNLPVIDVLGHGTSVFSSLSTYLASLRRMSSQIPTSSPPPRGYPGHGAVIPDVNAKIQEYIRHRQEREDEIVQALKDLSRAPESSGWITSMQIVKVVYKDTPENLHEAAERGVTMVLAKLEGEGKVVKKRIGDSNDLIGWRLVEEGEGKSNGRSVGRVAAL